MDFQNHFNIIDLVKEIPVLDAHQRYVGGDVRRSGNRFAVRCSRHSGGQEKAPSLILYPNNSWWCFGCNQGGSVVDLVMQALSVDFKDAVRVLATDFGISMPDASPEDRARARKVAEESRRRRELEVCFRNREKEVFIILAALYRAISKKLLQIKTETDLEQLGRYFHMVELVEYILDTLQNGEPTDRLGVLKDPTVRGWVRAGKEQPATP